MVAHTYDPSTREVETGGPEVQGQPWLIWDLSQKQKLKTLLSNYFLSYSWHHQLILMNTDRWWLYLKSQENVSKAPHCHFQELFGDMDFTHPCVFLQHTSVNLPLYTFLAFEAAHLWIQICEYNSTVKGQSRIPGTWSNIPCPLLKVIGPEEMNCYEALLSMA